MGTDGHRSCVSSWEPMASGSAGGSRAGVARPATTAVIPLSCAFDGLPRVDGCANEAGRPIRQASRPRSQHAVMTGLVTSVSIRIHPWFAF